MVAVSLFLWVLAGKLREVLVDGTATVRILKKEFFIKLFRLHLYNYYNGCKLCRSVGLILLHSANQT